MKTIKFLLLTSFIFSLVIFNSCQKKEDQQQNIQPQQEQYVDKEKELKEKEEMLRIKEQTLTTWEERLNKQDYLGIFKDKTIKDTTKTTAKDTTKTKNKKDDKKFTEKEKELNKRLDNPKTAVGDYLELIKRGISDTKTFDANMKKASEVWENRNSESFKKGYKDVKKFVVTGEPEVVSQKGSNASVKVKVKQSVLKNGKEEEKEITVTYNLEADKNGKWKIKNNIVK